MSFDYKYDSYIQPLYGLRRDIELDEILLQDNVLPHEYCIHDRVDMTNIPTYSIDPEGCDDADDAFSIYEEKERLFLAIHIADPTEFIDLKSKLWSDIESKVVTRYPSNKYPIHMMPTCIMSKSSLMENEHGNIKFAISVVTEINKITYLPVNKIRLLFTKIMVKTKNSLSYEEAGKQFYSNNVIYSGIRISNALQEKRSKKTKGTILNELSTSYVKFDNNTMDTTPYLYCDTVNERQMKHMIAEFAIFANSFVGEYLKINLNGKGLYRICAAKEWLDTLGDDIRGQELLNEIIVNGVQADYISNVESHDLVGSPEYCHFTSPIRRLSDCICHYLLKYIYLTNHSHNLPIPFTNEQLQQYSNDCVHITKTMKNIQYKDTKFRLIQVISHLLSLNIGDVRITYYVSSYTNGFFNIIINSINNHSVYLSYTLRIHNLSVEYKVKEIKNLYISKVNCLGRFDQGSLPELDNLYMGKHL
jgi:exoribonuclease R